MDAAYLQSTVGVALARGCAATAAAAPADPVEYLARWLHKYVASQAVESQLAAEKAAAAAGLAAEAARVAAVAQAQTSARARRSALLARVAAACEPGRDPWEAWAAAAEACGDYLDGKGAAYVAVVEERVKEKQKDSSDGGEEDVKEEAEAVEGESVYTRMVLNYVAACSRGQSALGKLLPSTQGVTMQTLQQGLPVLDIPNVLYRQGVHFFGNFPRPGAYFAVSMASPNVAVPAQSANGAGDAIDDKANSNTKKLVPPVCAILCVDSLRGGKVSTATGAREADKGQPFNDDEKDFVRTVANVVESALKRNEVARVGARPAEATAYGEMVAELARLDEAGGRNANDNTSDNTGANATDSGAGREAGEASSETAAVLELEKVKQKIDVINKAVGRIMATALPNLMTAHAAPKLTLAVLKAVYCIVMRSAGMDHLKLWKDARLEFQTAVQRVPAFDSSASVDAGVWEASERLVVDMDQAALAAESHLGMALLVWTKRVKELCAAEAVYQKAAKTAAEARAKAEAEAAAAAAALDAEEAASAAVAAEATEVELAAYSMPTSPAGGAEAIAAAAAEPAESTGEAAAAPMAGEEAAPADAPAKAE